MSNFSKFLKHFQDEFIASGLHLHKDHKIPKTRREFFASGVYAGAMTMAMPSLMQLFLSLEAKAEGLSCSVPEGLSGCPMVQFHFSGGRNLWGHGLALGLNSHGKPEDYTGVTGGFSSNDFVNYGASPRSHPSLSGSEYVTLGGHAMQQHSYIYQSAMDVFGSGLSDLESKMQIISFCHRTSDDSRDTEQNFLSMVRNLRGNSDFNLVSNNSGTNRSGLNAVPAFGVTEVSNIVTDKVNDLVGTGLESMPVDVRKKYFSALENYMRTRISNDEAHKVFGCGIDSAAKKVEKFSQTIDVRSEIPLLNTVFADDANGDRLASMVYLLENSLATCAGYTGGGFDYHNGSSDGYEKDRNIFTGSIWPIINYYHQTNKPIVMYFSSDGATYSNGSTDTRTVSMNGEDVDLELGVNIGDRGRNGGSMMIILAGNKANKPDVDFHQVGYGLDGGIAREGNPIGYDENNAKAVIFETMRRAMNHVSKVKSGVDFNSATKGKRFDEGLLGKYIPLKKS